MFGIGARDAPASCVMPDGFSAGCRESGEAVAPQGRENNRFAGGAAWPCAMPEGIAAGCRGSGEAVAP